MKSPGFTLLEVLIYLALFSMIMTGALVTAYLLIDTVAQNQEFEAAYTEGVFLNKKIAWAIQDAVDVEVIGTTTMKITRPGLDTIVLNSSSSRFWLQSGDSEPEPVSGPQFTLEEVRMTVSTTTSKRIEVEYSINKIPFFYETYIK